MKILISPAKSLDLETPIPVTNHSDLMFESAVKEVQQHLKSFKASELKSKMKISDKIAALNWERNQQFTWPMTEGESRQAVFAFNGDVYKGLDAYSLKEEEIANMQDMLLILSDIASFQASVIDPIYKQALKEAREKGVEVFAMSVKWNEKGEAYFNGDNIPIY